LIADSQLKYNWIDFDGANNILEVRISNSNVRPVTATLRVPNLNLSTIFPNTDVFFGFTAATGGWYEEHAIYSIYAANKYAPFPSNPSPSNYTQGISNITVTSSNNVSCPTQSSTLTVTATDQGGNPVPNASINLAVTSGTGTLTSATVVTNNSGIAYDTIYNINSASTTVRATDPLAGAYGTGSLSNSGATISGSLVGCIGVTSQLTGSGTAAASNAWVSSNTSVASINNSGLVSILSNGRTTITYTNNAGCSVSALFTGGVTISGNTALCIGTTSQLTSSGTPAASSPWTSSNTAVATINSTGLISSVSAGTATITYTTSNGCTATVTVTIQALPSAAPVVSITQPSCYVPTGTITVTSPLDASYLYSLDGVNYQASTIFNNVDGASYNVQIKTTIGCIGTATSTAVTSFIAQPTYTLVQPSCTTGTITLTPPTSGLM
jgi:hypothetical protein